MSFDYTDFKKLLAETKLLQKEYDAFLRKFLKEMALRALAKTKKRTPVDTGDLRNHWEVSDIFRRGDELVVYLSNVLDYASYVEYGHLTSNRERWVEGYFMATVSVADIDKELPARYEKAFRNFYGGLGL